MPSVATALKIIATAWLVAAGQATLAQAVVPAPPSVAPAAPPAWTVAQNGDGSAQISAKSKDGSAIFEGGCSRRVGPGFGGAFARYAGAGLQRIDGQIERVLFIVAGQEWREAFSAQLRYAASSRSWTIEKILAPVFVDSFSRGQTFTVVNGRGDAVVAFDLTGSTAAARAMRSACGFSPATGA